jgi:hypothetical protein
MSKSPTNVADLQTLLAQARASNKAYSKEVDRLRLEIAELKYLVGRYAPPATKKVTKLISGTQT